MPEAPTLANGVIEIDATSSPSHSFERPRRDDCLTQTLARLAAVATSASGSAPTQSCMPSSRGTVNRCVPTDEKQALQTIGAYVCLKANLSQLRRELEEETVTLFKLIGKLQSPSRNTNP